MGKKYTSPYFTNLRDSVSWFSDKSLNAAYNALDRNIENGNGNKTALIYEDENGKVTQFSFFSLTKKANKIANYLTHKIRVKKGDRVFLFLPQIPELYYSFLGILKTGAVAGTLYSTFQDNALKDRLKDAEAAAIFTTKKLLPRLQRIKHELPHLKHIIVIDEEVFENDFELETEHFPTVHTKPEDYAFLVYTSGTTGKPKGIVHAHYAIIQQIESARVCLDLKSDDIYWCTADPGCVTGLVYSILANWALGITTVVYSGKFDPEKWYELIQKHEITVLYTAPAAVRMLMAAGEEVVERFDVSSLRYLASGGEPLNPEAITWGKKVFNLFFHDGWLQAETGSIMIANHPDLGIHPGSMGKPLPWVTAAILDDDMQPVATHEEGNLCLKPYWPSMMRTIWSAHEQYDSYFKDGWYISGDRAYQDDKGYFWFVGRAEDVINTAGERIGSFELESALVEYPEVVEAGAIGKPDNVRGESIKAFVVLKPDIEPSEELKMKLQNHVRQHVAAHAYPKEIEFIDQLPKTKNGNIMRRILKAKEASQSLRDISTLEEY